MQYVIITTIGEFKLARTENNQNIVDTINAGLFPGLTTIDTGKGPVRVNLSEQIPFLMRGNSFDDTPTTRRKIIVS